MFAGGALIPAAVALLAGGLGHPVPLPRPDAQAWLPYDTPASVARFLAHWRPACGVLIRTREAMS